MNKLLGTILKQILLNQAVLLSGTLDPVSNTAHVITCELIEEIEKDIDKEDKND